VRRRHLVRPSTPPSTTQPFSNNKGLRAKVTRLRAKSQQKHGVRLPDGMQDLSDNKTEGLADQYFEKKNVSDDNFNKLANPLGGMVQ